MLIEASKFKAEPITPIEDLNKNLSCMKSKMEFLCMTIQKLFCDTLEQYESKKFSIDKWERSEGGGGITCVLQDGELLEKAGVNISVVHGDLNGPMQQYMQTRDRNCDFIYYKGSTQAAATWDLFEGGKNFEKGAKFFACGVSSVIHPRNPHVPTIHFNYRYFAIDTGNAQEGTWWFGGGTDLTPNYLNTQDVVHFHNTLKIACDKHNPEYYPKFKKICDEYFYIKHRGECRGVGGIFFDDLEGPSPTPIFGFVEECAHSVIPSYIPILAKNMNIPYGEPQRDWQLLRRGRYVEFNLIYDRGTKFGLATPGARYESILISLPLNAKWEYQHEVKPGTPESDLLEVLKKPKDWV